MEAKLILGDVTRSAHYLVDLGVPPAEHRDARSDGTAIGARADAPHLDPMVSGLAIVAQKRRWLIHIVHQDVHVAIVVKIAERATSAGMDLGQAGPGAGRYILKMPVAEVSEQEFRLGVGDVQPSP